MIVKCIDMFRRILVAGDSEGGLRRCCPWSRVVRVLIEASLASRFKEVRIAYECRDGQQRGRVHLCRRIDFYKQLRCYGSVQANENCSKPLGLCLWQTRFSRVKKLKLFGTEHECINYIASPSAYGKVMALHQSAPSSFTG